MAMENKANGSRIAATAIVFHVSRGTLGHVFTFVFHVKHWMGFGWGGETDIKNSIRICAVKKY